MSVSSRSVLVTGGAGYIGAHTCKALSQAGYLPVTYDNLSTGHREAVQWGPLEVGESWTARSWTGSCPATTLKPCCILPPSPMWGSQ